MNATPRLLNRLVLGALGALLATVGTMGLMLAASPGSTPDWWADASRSIAEVFSRTTLAGQRDSWLWVGVAAALFVALVLVLVWVAAQGRGRTGIFMDDDGMHDDSADSDSADDGESHSPAPVGRVVITAAAAEQALREALHGRNDLVNAVVTTYRFRGAPALRVRVYPRKGVAPQQVAAEVTELIEALDVVVGHATPVLINISTGARSRFTRAERVR